MNIKKDREFFASLESKLYNADREIDMINDTFQDEFLVHGTGAIMCDPDFALHLQELLIDAHKKRKDVLDEMAASADRYYKLEEAERDLRREKKHGATTAFKISRRFGHNATTMVDADGISIVDACEAEDCLVETSEELRHENDKHVPVRYAFDDGSAIVFRYYDTMWHIEDKEAFEPDAQYR